MAESIHYSMQEFDAQCDNIHARYDELRGMNIFPIKKSDGTQLDAAQLAEWDDELKKRTFSIAVCGQIKAGKSTLLNALLFQEDLIPEADTPLTAAITHIKYTEEPESWFEVEYYSREDWNSILKHTEDSKNLLADAQRDKKANTPEMQELQTKLETFNKEIEATKKKLPGKSIETLLGTKEKIPVLSRAKLEEFVAPVSGVEAKGRFTPLVKEVTLYIHNENLRHVSVVDTPGTNDTNVARSRLTLDWIKKANAVIFLTYAGRAFDKKDIDFIDEHLLHVPSALNIVVINKIDTLNKGQQSIDAIKNYFKNDILENEDIKRKRVFTKDTAHACVSALAERLYQKKEKGIALSDDDKFYLNNIKKAGATFFEHLHELFAEFRNVLESRLIANTGKNIILTHAKRVESVLQEATRNMKAEYNRIKQLLEDLKKDPDGLVAKIQKLKNARIELNNIGEKNKRTIEQNTKNCIDAIAFQMGRIRQALKTDIESKIFNAPDLDYFDTQLAWDIKSLLSNIKFTPEARKIKTVLRTLEDDYQNTISDIEVALRQKLPSFTGIAEIHTACNIVVENHFAAFANTADNVANNEVFQKIHKEYKRTFLFLFEWRKDTTLKDCKNRALNLIDALLNPLGESEYSLCTQVSDRQSDILTSIQNIFKGEINEQQKTIEEIQQKLNENKKVEEELESGLQNLEDRLKNLLPKQQEMTEWCKNLSNLMNKEDII